MARKRSTRRTPRLGRLGRWLSAERKPLAGLAVIGIATLFAVWVSLAEAPVPAQREALIGALGGGVYLVGLILAGLGTAVALRLRRPSGVQTRRGAGVLALLAAAWGIAGALSPEATLGGVSLAENSLGGDVGAGLATGRGAIVIALLVLGGVALISPQFSRSAALVGGRLIRSGGRELAARGRESSRRWRARSGPGIRWYFQLVGGRWRRSWHRRVQRWNVGGCGRFQHLLQRRPPFRSRRRAGRRRCRLGLSRTASSRRPRRHWRRSLRPLSRRSSR